MEYCDTDKLIAFRKKLHQHAERSGNEYKTAEIVDHFFHKCEPDEKMTGIGKTGIAYIYNGIKKGPTILFRADMDAVPVQESGDRPWKSLDAGTSHTCGHDGHMAMLAGFGLWLRNNKLNKGRIVLLFQPAEENGSGAFSIINDPRFSAIEPDVALALHNIPGYTAGTLLLKEGVFALASKGIRFMFQGITAHASDPSKGISPIPAVLNFIRKGQDYASTPGLPGSIAICHVRAGDASFGVCPGEAVVHVTVRAGSAGAMQTLCDELIAMAAKESGTCGVVLRYDFHDEFPETSNNADLISLCRKAATDSGLKTKRLKQPFSWSEDFGYFTSQYRAALIGIGAGTNHPPLHHPGYDFPDTILSTGIKFYVHIARQILGKPAL